MTFFSVLRTIICLAYVGFFMLCGIVLFPIEFFIRRKDEKKAMRFSVTVTNWGFRCVTALTGSKVTVKGKENIPAGEAVLFVGNHRSYFDLIAGYYNLPFHTSIVSKAGLKKAPVIGGWMKRFKCLFIEQNSLRQGMQMIKDAQELMKNGTNILIFPEGTRNKGEGVGELHAGSLKIATKPGFKIVPVVFTNTREIFEKQFPWVKPQKVTMEFLAPIDTSGMTREEIKALPEALRKILLETFEKNNSIVI